MRLSRPPARHGGQNKIIQPYQERAIVDYVRRQHEDGFSASKQMVFAAIGHLRASEIPEKAPPSWRWFTNWLHLNQSYFTVLKTKPIARERTAAQDPNAVQA